MAFIRGRVDFIVIVSVLQLSISHQKFGEDSLDVYMLKKRVGEKGHVHACNN